MSLTVRVGGAQNNNNNAVNFLSRTNQQPSSVPSAAAVVGIPAQVNNNSNDSVATGVCRGLLTPLFGTRCNAPANARPVNIAPPIDVQGYRTRQDNDSLPVYVQPQSYQP